MGFEKWSTVHNSPDQQKRMKSASSAECTPVSVNSNNLTGVFCGKHGQYITSLEQCECGDFTRRRMPCKHMYRLAHELGAFDIFESHSHAPILDLHHTSFKKNSTDIQRISAFAYWNETDNIDQIKRFVSAADCECIECNESLLSGLFAGTLEVYDTSLEECNCKDFTERMRPCKHIYSLARQLGFLNADGTRGERPNPPEKELPSDVFERLRELTVNFPNYTSEGRRMIGQYARSSVDWYAFCPDLSQIDDVVSDGLFIVLPRIPSDEEAITKGGQKRTVRRLTEVGFEFQQDLKLQRDKYQWCLDHAKEIRELIYPECRFVYASDDLRKNAFEIKRIMYYLFDVGKDDPLLSKILDSHIVPNYVLKLQESWGI